jgi:hypothetical protein
MNQPPHLEPPSPRPNAHLPVYKWFTDPLRVLPDFLIIGVQKGGTTSLYNYLIQHPCIYPAYTKEVHFFDQHFDQGLTEYRSYFPTGFKKYYKTIFKKHKFITGEATPYYIFHPLVAQRVAKILPNVKLIILLRNPIDRAYSHYQHEVKLGFEKILSFEDAIAQEDERLAEEVDRMMQNPSYKSYNYQHYSYLSRGIYISQIQKWQQFFKPEQFLILSIDDLLINPTLVYQKTLDFLGLPEWYPKTFEKYNRNQYSTLNPETRQKLVNYFQPKNQQLYEYLGVQYDWD